MSTDPLHAAPPPSGDDPPSSGGGPRAAVSGAELYRRLGNVETVLFRDILPMVTALWQAEARAAELREKLTRTIEPIAAREKARVEAEGRMEAERAAKDATAASERAAFFSRLLGAIGALTKAENLRTVAIIVGFLLLAFRPDLAATLTAMYARVLGAPAPIAAPVAPVTPTADEPQPAPMGAQ